MAAHSKDFVVQVIQSQSVTNGDAHTRASLRYKAKTRYNTSALRTVARKNRQAAKQNLSLYNYQNCQLLVYKVIQFQLLLACECRS